jgi:transcriptional regulator with XRE-family HTH domain
MVLFRRLLGEVLRRHRQRQGRTLRDVAAAARVSLGYLSEVERGVKEASSELLSAVCEALEVSLAEVLREVSDDLVALERRPLRPVGFASSVRSASARPVAGVAPRVAGRATATAVAHRVGDEGERVAVPSAALRSGTPLRSGPPVASMSARSLPVVAA